MGAEAKPPRQVALVQSQFPAEGWATSLVNQFNQFALETVRAFGFVTPKYKVLVISTGATVADSFPIDIPIDFAPTEVRVAMVLSGVPSGAVTVVGTPILANNPVLRVTSITGLAANSTYSIRLAME